MNFAKLVGIHYKVLGWISVAQFAVGVFLFSRTGTLTLDVSFLLWFWLGSAIPKHHKAARVVAIVVSLLAIIVIVGAAVGGISPYFWGRSFSPTHPGFFIVHGTLLVLLGLPGLVLLSKEARDQYRRPEITETKPDTPEAACGKALSEQKLANLCGVVSVVLAFAAWGFLVNLGMTGSSLTHHAKTLTGYACIGLAVAGLACGVLNALRGTHRVAGVIGLVLSVLWIGAFTGLFSSAASIVPMHH